MTKDQIGSRYIDDRPAIIRWLCHALPERSFWFKGHPMIFCSRCTLIYLMISPGILAGFLLISLVDPAMRYVLAAVALLLMPTIIDGITQFYGWRESNNLLRAITGALFGSGIGIAMTYLVMRLILDI